MESVSKSERMIGCRNCQAAVPISSRFCRRCGAAMHDAPVRTPRIHETHEERRVRLEAEIDARAAGLYSGQSLTGFALALFVIGGLCVMAGLPALVIILFWVLAGMVFVMDVRRHIAAHEEAERRVRREE